MTAQFGMIGLGTMGRNFLLNVAEHGIAGVGYDLDENKRRLLLEEGKGMPLETAEDIPAFLAKLALPRRIMLLVPAGPIVDSVINDLLSHLEPGDIIIDGGNSHFTDTERREESLRRSGVEFLGVGVSGGEEGARHGASIMVGGNPEVYQHIRPILEAASAKVNGEPCAAHVGKGSAGHFVKMVHNGIEYGMMQLIAETFDFMQRGLRMAYPEMNRTFAEWNGGDLNSFLIEITADVLRKIDPDTGANLVSVILDTAGQKGTGKWTSQAAMDLGVPIPTIDSAVTMRQISAAKALRIVLSANRSGPRASSDAGRSRTSASELKDALLCAFVLTYTQGMSLLNIASTKRATGSTCLKLLGSGEAGALSVRDFWKRSGKRTRRIRLSQICCSTARLPASLIHAWVHSERLWSRSPRMRYRPHVFPHRFPIWTHFTRNVSGQPYPGSARLFRGAHIPEE